MSSSFANLNVCCLFQECLSFSLAQSEILRLGNIRTIYKASGRLAARRAPASCLPASGEPENCEKEEEEDEEGMARPARGNIAPRSSGCPNYKSTYYFLGFRWEMLTNGTTAPPIRASRLLFNLSEASNRQLFFSLSLFLLESSSRRSTFVMSRDQITRIGERERKKEDDDVAS